MSPRIYPAFYLLVLLNCGSLFAGTTGKIAGTITDKSSGEPLAGVNVMIKGTTLGAATDLEGFFYIINVSPGVHTIEIQMIGYKTTTVTEVRVKIDQTSPLDFTIEPAVLEGEEISIVATRPKVELDLTGSKQTMTDVEIRSSAGLDVEQVIEDLPGVNINGGIRGGFGLDVAYVLDGMDMRDIGSNTNFTTVNLTTIQELELVSGGWNAEYGQANGAFVNMVSKSAMDRIRGVVSIKIRPAGQYHWGGNIYDSNDIFHTVMTTPEFWDPDATWQTPWMDEPLTGYNGGKEPFISMTPEERARWWSNFINDKNLHPQIDYTQQMQWEKELTLYGPIFDKLAFMFSARYREGVPNYPSALKYNPDMTFQGNLTYRFTPNTKFELNGIYTNFTNTGAPRSNWGSTEDSNHNEQVFPYVGSPYHIYKYWLYGALSGSRANIRPPEKANLLNLQAKLTHVFSHRSFLEVALQHGSTEFKLDYLDILQSERYGPDGERVSPDPPEIPNTFETWKWDRPGDIWRKWIWSTNSTLKADFTSQISLDHQIKTGLLFSLQSYEKVLHDYQSSGDILWAQVTDLAETKTNPYEGAFYIQDKMEFEGMVINAGIRLDFYNANKNVSADIFDPLMIGDSAVGHVGSIGHISWDANGSGPGYHKTPTQVAFSPRLGLSHPISESTVLHFMIGKFNQRPPWNKIVGPAVARTLPPDDIDSDWDMHPDSQLVVYKYYTDYTGNPALTWEKMTQYEIGLKQNIANDFLLDLTLFYRDAYDLTSMGIKQGGYTLNVTDQIQKSGGDVQTRLYGDPNNPTNLIPGQGIGYFRVPVNGGWANVRGLEATIQSRFRFINFRLSYIMSILSTGQHNYGHIAKEFDGEKLREDEYNGADNGDNGHNGEDDDTWNPHNTAKLQIFINSPRDFGPSFGNFYILGDWTINTTTTWAAGRRFTYHAPDDVSIEPNNMIWKGRWNTNLSIIKAVSMFEPLLVKFSLQVRNLFNDKHLMLPDGEDAQLEYFESGILPYHNTTREPMVWNWYRNRPREVYLGMVFEF